MAAHTADAVAVLAYLVDALPPAADRVFAEAEAGEATVEVPSTTLAEVLHSVSRDKDVRGLRLTGTLADARRALVANGPVSLVAVDDDAFAEYTDVVDEFSIRDAVVVASHRARDTEAILTTDGVLQAAGCETVWE